MPSLSLKDWREVSGLMVDIVVLLGALIAAIKFRIYNLFGHRWRSDLACAHYELSDSSVIFTADYTVHNTGQRPLHLTTITVSLARTMQDGLLVVADNKQIFASRVFEEENPAFKGLCQIEPGERSIFPIRVKLPALDDVIFVLCEFKVRHKRVPGAYRGMYVKSKPANPGQEQNSSASGTKGQEQEERFEL